MSENSGVGLNGIRFSSKEELRAYANAQYSVTHTRKVCMPDKKPYYVSTSRQIDLVCNDKFCWCLVKGRREKGKGAELKDRPWYIQEGSRLRHYNVDEDGNEMPCAGGKKRVFTATTSAPEGEDSNTVTELEDIKKPEASTLEADIPATPESALGQPKARKRPMNAARNDLPNEAGSSNGSGDSAGDVSGENDHEVEESDEKKEATANDIKTKKKNGAADKKKK